MRQIRICEDLVTRWDGQEKRIRAILADIEANRDWTHRLLASEEDGWDRPLPHVETCNRPRLHNEACPRDLRGLIFSGANLSHSERLADTCLDGCRFDKVLLNGASLIGASLRGVRFRDDCVLDGVRLDQADISYGIFRGVSMMGANLSETRIDGADFEDADLRGVLLRPRPYKEEGVLGFLTLKAIHPWPRFGGTYQAVTDLDHRSDIRSTAYVADENTRRSLSHSPCTRWMFYLFLNYGRSPARLFVWLVVVWLAFGVLYAGYPMPSCISDLPFIAPVLCVPTAQMVWPGGQEQWSWFAPYYLSAVTLTTLGFGDVTPEPYDWLAQMYVCVETILGFLFLSLFVAYAVIRTRTP